MELTINIKYKGKDSETFAKEMIESGLVEKIRAQKGNLRYEYFKSLEKDNEILLIDEWNDHKP